MKYTVFSAVLLHSIQAAKDLKAKKIMTVHHSKYALAKHPWDEPLANEKKMQEQDSLNMVIPEIGEVMPL